jgi:quercetin dioxygenase-like cupin family protein
MNTDFCSPDLTQESMNMSGPLRYFVTLTEAVRGNVPWAIEEWLCRADVVENEQLLMVRVNMEPGKAHAFHKHPTREELLYVLSGRAEQWVGKEHRILGPGEVAFVPTGEVHGTYNPFSEKLVFLAILAPAKAPGPALVDVSTEEPWRSLRQGFPPTS